jgi:hypothetical protein
MMAAGSIIEVFKEYDGRRPVTTNMITEYGQIMWNCRDAIHVS